ncbi:MAG: flavodoxin [Euryarchaeota archaeon]|nr:flavodoxin [Euryarchaeota archaeon]
MNIGIIVHSQTEHTYSVAQTLKEKLSAEGHSTKVERVIPAGDVPPRAKNVKFESRPEVDVYDALIFGAPVQAFSLSAVMTAYMRRLPSLQDKKIACFVTKGLPFNWTGGNRAISQMKKICQSKGGTVIGTGIIIWNKNREIKIVELVEQFSGLF